jgi:hypothetical protein
MTNPTEITCTRCGSTVPWGPYCPQCSAYLEFAGDPPWSPEPPGDLAEGTVESTEEMSVIGDADAGGAPDGDPVVEVATETDLVPHEFESLFRPEYPVEDRVSTGSEIAEVVLIGVAGAGVALVAGWLAQWWIGVLVAAFVAGWCLVLVGSWRSRPVAPVEVERRIVTYPEVDWDATMVEVVEPALPAEPPVLQARAPQQLPSQVVERTVAMGSRTVSGDTPCPECGALNEASRHYCEWCGCPMPGAYLGPTVAVSVQEMLVQDSAPASPPRRLTRSWRTAILVFTLIGVFLGAVVFALFGPNAFRVQFGITQVYQAIHQFVDPKTGQVLTPESVEASSTLLGTSPTNAQGLDGRNFWASEPSFDFGAGTILTFTLAEESTIDRMLILPGTQRSQFGARALATPRDITLTFDDGTSADWTLRPVNSDRDLEQLVKFPRVRTQTVTLTIDSSYPPGDTAGDQYGEVAVAGVAFIAPPTPPSVLRLPTEPRPSVFGSST